MINEQNLLIGVSRECQIEVENICTQKNLTLSELFAKMFKLYKMECETSEQFPLSKISITSSMPPVCKILADVLPESASLSTHENKSYNPTGEVMLENQPVKRKPGRPPKV